MKKFIYISMPPIILLFFMFIICNNDNGLFGHSKTKEEAKANGSNILEYIPDKMNFKLLDGTAMQIDTAWTEMSFTYRDGKRDIDSTYGYNFAIPYKREAAESFSFTFSLADTLNRVFTNGREENVCQLHPRNLYEKMVVLLEQKNPDTSKGWTSPIISDTILFTRIK